MNPGTLSSRICAWYRPGRGTVNSADIKLEYPLQAADREYVDSLIDSRRVAAGKPLVCIHPGTGADSKLWRAEGWAQVADRIAADYGASIVFTGTPSEVELVIETEAAMATAALSVAGQTSIGQLAALYARSRAVMGPDSGALHLAAAVGTPTVALFGPADPREFAPWGDPRSHVVITTDIACRPCRILDWRTDNMAYHPCVRDITGQQVLEAARRVMSSQQRPEPA